MDETEGLISLVAQKTADCTSLGAIALLPPTHFAEWPLAPLCHSRTAHSTASGLEQEHLLNFFSNFICLFNFSITVYFQ